MPSVNLRPVQVADAELIHRWRSEASIARYQPLRPIDLDEVRAMILARAQSKVGPDSAGDYQWIVLADDQPSGWISLKIAPADRPHGIGSIGYAVGEAGRQRGIGCAAVGALLPIAFDRGGFDIARLEAIAAVDNAASRRVLERNGFRFEGVRRGLLIIHGERIDHAMYGLLRSDWEQ